MRNRATPAAAQLREELHRALRTRVEHGVAAADVGLDGMVHAGAIAQRDLVAIARATARAVVASLGEQRRDHAVLHVKQRHRVVEDHLGPRSERDARRRRSDEIEELRGVEVERRREGGEPAAEDLGGGRGGSSR